MIGAKERGKPGQLKDLREKNGPKARETGVLKKLRGQPGKKSSK
jgi:hypothetical protein